eukprot:5040822-Pyramimonas_sp.AAC.1
MHLQHNCPKPIASTPFSWTPFWVNQNGETQQESNGTVRGLETYQDTKQEPQLMSARGREFFGRD